MSNAPEWVEPEGDEPSQARPPDPRAVTIELLRAQLNGVKTAAHVIANALLRLDEMGEPVKRARVRAGNLADYVEELNQIVRFDIEQGQGKRTSDQKVRAERHELS